MNVVIQTVVLAAIGVALLSVWFVIFWHYMPKIRANKKGEAPAKARNCPLCGSLLARGEVVKSVVFPGKPDRIMHVFGCPHCLPPDGELERICPVCKKTVQVGGYVIGRYFEAPGRHHLHVLGCTSCRERKGREHTEAS
jgi:hypothetical protein